MEGLCFILVYFFSSGSDTDMIKSWRQAIELDSGLLKQGFKILGTQPPLECSSKDERVYNHSKEFIIMDLY